MQPPRRRFDFHASPAPGCWTATSKPAPDVHPGYCRDPRRPNRRESGSATLCARAYQRLMAITPTLRQDNTEELREWMQLNG
jgi:hypothetical protein